MTDDRPKMAYSIFRGGLRKDVIPPPHWDELEPWMRDAMRVAYLQGKLDGTTPPHQARDGQTSEGRDK